MYNFYHDKSSFISQKIKPISRDHQKSLKCFNGTTPSVSNVLLLIHVLPIIYSHTLFFILKIFTCCCLLIIYFKIIIIIFIYIIIHFISKIIPQTFWCHRMFVTVDRHNYIQIIWIFYECVVNFWYGWPK